jgi:CHAD domain-containing protein
MKKSNRNISTSNRQTNPEARGIEAYFNAHNKALQNAILLARNYYAVEGIHELRVEIKRLRALYKLVEYMAPSFAAKQNASFLKPIFREAGKLRDIDINQATTLKYLKGHDLREYFNQLKQKELKLRTEFKKINFERLSKTNLTRSGSQIHLALSASTSESARRLMKKKIIKLTNKLYATTDLKKQSNDVLHSIRKASKTLRYLLDIYQQCYNNSKLAENAGNSLKNTYTYLGEWRDIVLTADSVTEFLEHKAARDLVDPAAYESFIADLNSKSRNLLISYNRSKIPLKKALRQLLIGLQD